MALRDKILAQRLDEFAYEYMRQYLPEEAYGERFLRIVKQMVDRS